MMRRIHEPGCYGPGMSGDFSAVWLAAILLITIGAAGPENSNRPLRDQDAPSSATAIPGQSAGPGTQPAVVAKPEDGSLPLDRAWESNPYRVRVWLCTDGSAAVSDLLPQLAEAVELDCRLVDGSGWEVFVGPAPNPWFWRCARDFNRPERLTSIASTTELKFDDKLIVVLLRDLGNGIACQARELDLATQQWGAVQERLTGQLESLSQHIAKSVQAAFMPLARVEQVPTDNSIILSARAVDACVQTQMDEKLIWVAKFNQASPVAVRIQDNFLTVVRKTDRANKLASLEPIEFTFIKVQKIEGAKITGVVHSAVRAPLSGRTSKRLQKLALVIRPQPRPTVLQFLAADDKTVPMEGLEVFSRKPDFQKTDPSEFIGKTDWRGMVEIPPGDEPLRLIYLKRGSRAMKKVPVIPGFHDRLTTDVVNDEARLFAEGIVLGIQTEVLDLAVQREAYEQEILLDIEQNDWESARANLLKYQELPSVQKLASALGDEETRLTTLAKSKKEIEYIKSMFLKIKEVLQTKIANTREAELRQKIQSGGPPQQEE